MLQSKVSNFQIFQPSIDVIFEHGFFSAIHCPDSAGLLNATSDSTSTIFNTTRNYICKDGHLFPDLTEETTTTCLANKTWSNTMPGCKREY